MEEFGPLLMIVIFWVLIGIPITIAKKQADQKKAAAKATARKTPQAETQPVRAPQGLEPERLTTITPTVYEPDHDDSVFTGSLGPLQSEGYDPCHEDQMHDMELVCEPGKEHTPAPQPARSGIPLGWTNNDVVRGIVMSEILNRKKAG